jgi:hypothetical protein
MEAQQNPQPTPAPTKPQSSHLLKKIILIALGSIALILVIGATGVYFLARQLLPPTANSKTTTQDATKILNNPVVKKMIEQAPIPKITMIPVTVTLSPTIAISTPPQQTTNWKTYQNSVYNFSINYPGNLTSKENDHGFGVTDVVFFDPTQGSSEDAPQVQFLLFPQSIGSLIGQDFDELYNLPNPSAQVLKMESGSQQFTKLQNTTIQGSKAFSFQSTAYPPAEGEQPSVGIYIEIGDNILTISTNQTNQAVLDAMIKTFIYPLK